MRATRRRSANSQGSIFGDHHAKRRARLIWITRSRGRLSRYRNPPLFLADQSESGEKRLDLLHVHRVDLGRDAAAFSEMVDHFGEEKLSQIGLVLLAAGLAAYPFVHSYVLLAIVVALVPLGTAFTFPCVTSLLSRVISSSERGLYMGVQQTFGGLSRVVIPLWAGFSYDQFGRAIPFLTSAALVCSR